MNIAFQVRFLFEDEFVVKRYTLLSFSKLWKEHKCCLYNEFVDETLSREGNISNVPLGVSNDQGIAYFDMCQLLEMKVLFAFANFVGKIVLADISTFSCKSYAKGMLKFERSKLFHTLVVQ